MRNSDRMAALLAKLPVVLAPMEDVTNAAYRQICRTLGAHVCVTEFIGAAERPVTHEAPALAEGG